MTEFEIRKLERSDFEGLSQLYDAVYGVKFNSAYWEWKYYKNPFGGHMMYVALEGEKIIGSVGTIPVGLQYGESTPLGSQTCDITVHPDYQKGGTFLKLYKLSNEENARRVLLCYGFSVPITLKISTRLLKFRPVCSIWRWVFVIDPTPFIEKKIKVPAIAQAAGFIGRKVINARTRRHYKKTETKVREVDWFDESFNRFWEKRKRDYNLMVRRDAKYLNWRYAEHPLETYKIFAYQPQGEMKGFIVLTTIEEDIRRGFIMDIMADPNEEDAVDYLLTAAMKHFYEESISSVTLWLPKNSPITKNAGNWGFICRQTHHNLIVKIYRPKEEVDHAVLMNSDNWYFTMGDSDYH